jgi:DNA-binding CsgD family transcriptional regulator
MPKPLGTRAIAVRETIAELCENPPETTQLVREVAERLRRVVPHETAAWMTTDPETVVPTAMIGLDASPELGVAFRDDEVHGNDVNSFGQMLRSGGVVSTLATDTGGDLERSPRYREISRPRGLGDEMRVVARTGNETWAIACLNRAADSPSFTDEEIAYVRGIAELLGRGVRTSLARAPAEPERLDALGMLVVRADDTIEASTGQAMRWLERLPVDKGRLPTSISMVSLMARANATGAPGARPARLRLLLPGGGWLLVHADVLEDGSAEPGRTAVVLEPADRAQLLPLLFALHGLTGRERQVAELLVAGRSTDEIATQLHISRHTLRDHVKAIFAKVGVSSRPELTAALAA